jgi:hypothetical protein
LKSADRAEPPSEIEVTRLQERIALLKKQMTELKVIEKRVAHAPDGQVSLTDPDARSMNSRGSGIVGYNVQAPVEADHHLIIAHEITMNDHDRAAPDQ